MNSFQRFLVFLILLAVAVSGLYFWKAVSGVPVRQMQEPVLTGLTGGGGQKEHSVLRQLDQDFQALVQRVRPSVVSITAESTHAAVHGARGVASRIPPNLGSGVIVSSDGFIVTNAHVIQGAGKIFAALHDGATYAAEVLGQDPLTDIAILKIEAESLQSSPFGDSDQVRPGQIVFAVGNPYGLQETVTQGIISGIGRRSTSETVNEFFQTDTAINPGNSGGPLLDVAGRIIGINNAIHTKDGGWQGIGFSIPSNTAKKVYEDIKNYGRIVRAFFGVVWSRNLTPQLAKKLGLPDEHGVLIQYAVEDSPASKAGIQAGDVIVAFNGRKILDGIDLRNRVAGLKVGQSIPVTVVRNGKTIDLEVRLSEMPVPR